MINAVLRQKLDNFYLNDIWQCAIHDVTASIYWEKHTTISKNVLASVPQKSRDIILLDFSSTIMLNHRFAPKIVDDFCVLIPFIQIRLNKRNGCQI